jgi:nicotinamidase-related amidase
VPELGQYAGDYRLTKHHVGAFSGTGLDEYLKQRNVTQIFITGIATSVGVEMTGRCGFDLGFNVVYVVDAMTDMSAEAHRYCVENVFPRFGETDTTENVMKALGQKSVG